MMAAQSDEDALFRNVQDLRRKLQQTELSLATLQQLEVRDGDDVKSLPSRSSSPGGAMPLTVEDLTPEEPFQGIHSLPGDNRHYRSSGFVRVNKTDCEDHSTNVKKHQMKAHKKSTGSKHNEWREPKIHENEKEKVLTEGLHHILGDKRWRECDEDVQGTMCAAAAISGKGPGGSCSTEGVRMHIHGSKESQATSGQDSLHQRLHLVREENSQLISQNHKLLDQLESAGYQLHQANTRASQLMADVKGCKQQVSQLEDHVGDLEDALRQGEERYDASQSQLEDLHTQLEDLQSQLEEVEAENERYHTELGSITSELEQEQVLRERTEEERDSAMQRIDELQNKLEEIQKRAKERIKKVQSSEEHLRENLCHADHDREELMEANDTLRKQLEVANKELRLLQENQLIDRETKSKLEQEAVDCQAQLRQMSSDMKKYERELVMKETLMKENNELKHRVDELQRHLASYQRQISDSQTQLHLLEERVTKIQHDKAQNKMETDSGVSLSKARSSTPDPKKSCDPPAVFGEGLDASYLETIRSQDTEISRVNAIQEMRELLHQKDEEIQELKHQLSLRLSPKPSTSQTIDALKKELQAVIDRHKQGEGRLQEQEQLINKLQVERARYTSQISGLEQKLADFEVQYASLEARFTQRQSQLSDIHKEITERENHISTLEREVRKRTSQIASLEHQLDGKVSEVTEQVARATELEEELMVVSGRMEKMRRELDDTRQGSRGNEAMMEKMRTLHSEQCQELERQLDMAAQKLERKTQQLMDLEEDLRRVKDDLDIKDVALAEARRELELHSQHTTQRFKDMEEKYKESTERVAHLDSALHVCKEELRVNLEKLEDSHEASERETLEREVIIADLQRQLAESQQLCDEKEAQFAALETALEERQMMLQESAERIVELEDGQTLLETQMGHLEQNLDRQKSQWVRDTSDMESKLAMTSTELQQRLDQVQELNNSIRVLEADKKKLGEEVANFQKKYNRLKNEKEEREKSCEKLESKLRDVQGELRHKAEMVEDLEEQLRALEYDFDERAERVNTMDAKLKDTQGELHMARRRIQELEDEVDQALKDAGKKQEILESLRHSLRCSQDELRSRNRELEEAEQVAKQQQWDLEQRAKQILQIDRQVKERQSDLQGQVGSMETDLRKVQQELRSKEKKLLELEAEKQVLQGELNEKTHHLQQARGKLSQHQQDMDDITNRHRLTDREIQKLHTQLEDALEENRDLLLQLNKIREEKGRIQQELQETSRDLAISQREQERLSRELSDINTSAKDREVQLGGELSDAKTREVQMEKNMSTEIQKLQRDLENLKDHHQNEIQEMEESHEKSSENYLEQIEQQKEWLEDAKEREARLLRELEISHEEVANLQKEVLRLEGDLGKLEHELHKRQRFLCEAQESVILKDAEITRLEGRVSSMEQIRSMKIAERMSALKGHANLSAPSVVNETNNSQSTGNGSYTSQIFTSTPTKAKKQMNHEGSDKMKVSDLEPERFDASSVSSIGHAVVTDSAHLESREPLRLMPEDQEHDGPDLHKEGNVFSSLEHGRKGSSDPDSLLGMWRQLQEQGKHSEGSRSADSDHSKDSRSSGSGECNNNVINFDSSELSGKSDDFEKDASFGQSKIPVQSSGKGARPKVKSKKSSVDVFTRLSQQPADKQAKTKPTNTSLSASSVGKTAAKSLTKSIHVKLAKPVMGKASGNTHKEAAGPSGQSQQASISPENRKSIQSQYEIMFGELEHKRKEPQGMSVTAGSSGSMSNTGASAIQALGQQLLQDLANWQEKI